MSHLHISALFYFLRYFCFLTIYYITVLQWTTTPTSIIQSDIWIEFSVCMRVRVRERDRQTEREREREHMLLGVHSEGKPAVLDCGYLIYLLYQASRIWCLSHCFKLLWHPKPHVRTHANSHSGMHAHIHAGTKRTCVEAACERIYSVCNVQFCAYGACSGGLNIVFFFYQNLIFGLFFCVVLFLIFRVGLGLGDTAT